MKDGELLKTESLPGGTIDRLVAVLGRVPAGGIDQHRLVGKEPIAVTGTADAPNGVFAERVRQREFKPRVGERRGLARARRSNHQIPWQLVKLAARAPTAQARALEHGQRVLEALGQDLPLLARCYILRVLLSRRLCQSLQHGFVGLALPQCLGNLIAEPRHDDGQDHDHSRQLACQRNVPGERQSRPEHPDEHRDDDQTENGNRPAVDDPAEKLFQHPDRSPNIAVPPPLCLQITGTRISTRRLSARPSAVVLSPTGSESARASMLSRSLLPIVAESSVATDSARDFDR